MGDTVNKIDELIKNLSVAMNNIGELTEIVKTLSKAEELIKKYISERLRSSINVDDYIRYGACGEYTCITVRATSNDVEVDITLKSKYRTSVRGRECPLESVEHLLVGVDLQAACEAYLFVKDIDLIIKNMSSDVNAANEVKNELAGVLSTLKPVLTVTTLADNK